MTGTQGKKTLLIVQQFPGQAEYTGNVAYDADLALLAGLQAPRLQDAHSPEASKYSFIQPIAQFWK